MMLLKVSGSEIRTDKGGCTLLMCLFGVLMFLLSNPLVRSQYCLEIGFLVMDMLKKGRSKIEMT